MRYIITGIGGHLGNTLASLLVKQGDTVTGLALRTEDCSMLPKEVRVVRGDVLAPESLEPLFDNTPSILIHTAGLISITKKGEKQLYEVNVQGTKNIIEASLKHAVQRLVYVSSVHAIPVLKRGEQMKEISSFDPALVKGAYAKSKAMATQLVLESQLDVVVVHPSGLIGPDDYGGGFLTRVLGDYADGKLFLSLRGGFDFVDVRDVAKGIIKASVAGQKGSCYILGNRYCSIREMADTLRSLVGQKPVSCDIPLSLVKFFIPLCNLYFKTHGEKALLTQESIAILGDNADFSHQKAERELDYHPRSIEESMRDTLAFLLMMQEKAEKQEKQENETKQPTSPM